MDKTGLKQQALFMRTSLLHEGYLDEQFIQLEELEDDVNPNFVEEIVTLFYSDSVRLIYNIERALITNPPNFTKLDDYMHQFKGSCSSIGAKKVMNECTRFSEYCAAENFEGCFRTFQQINLEYTTLKRKLETYLQVSLLVSFSVSKGKQLKLDGNHIGCWYPIRKVVQAHQNTGPIRSSTVMYYTIKE
ncbi:histidine-containing phosphotransfer protein 4-like [Abrus precatorius]|uniref:Histidine-containing phosphotransfer protein n=1 Tax=Abrus precatorius TaxID=3816 RepID=A0A8B8LLP3_ABRPR|nr:histidine-containing phosphotransfer protein 4-like [Abrus precatorius]